MMRNTLKRRKALLCALVSSTLLLGMTDVLHAKEQEFSLEQVVVTATKTPVKEFEANANITVITRQDIENKHYSDLAEALRSVPGVTVLNYSGAGYDNSNAFRIFGSEKVVVLIDGVRVNAAGVNFPASAFKNLQNIEQIEVLKGAASTLYGSDAKGGVINIITRKVEGSQSTLTLSNGSYGGETYSFTNQGMNNGYSWLVTAQKDILADYKDAHKFEVGQHLNAESASVQLTKQLNAVSDLKLSYDQYKSDVFYTDSNKKQNIHRYGWVDRYNLRLIHNYKFSDGSQNQLSYFHSKYNTKFNTTINDIKTIGIQEQYTTQWGKDHLVTVGFDFTEDEVLTMNGRKLSSRAFYAQDEWDLTSQWKLTSGVRRDDYSSFGSHVTPKFNLGYKQNENTNYYIAYSEYFITPTPSQLYHKSYGNADLKPEEGHLSEIGINHNVDDTMTISAHLFRRSSEDMIGYLKPKYINMDSEKVRGWDVQVNKRLSNTLDAFVGYTRTHIDPTAQRAANYDGYIAKGAWDIGLNYHEGKYNIQLEGQGMIDRPGPLTADALEHFFPATTYWVWNLAANYEASKTIRGFIKVNNLFNQYYAEHSNARENWGGEDREWWTRPGRNYQAGVEYRF